MEREGIAVVGDKDSVLAFKAIGLDAFPLESEDAAEDTLKKLARTYAVIFVTESVAQRCEALIKRYKARPYPVVVPIPSAVGSSGFGMRGVKADVEKAVGADILFDREEK